MVFMAKSPCSWSRLHLSSMLELESKMILCHEYHIYSLTLKESYICIDISWFIGQNLYVLDQDDPCPPSWSWSQRWYYVLNIIYIHLHKKKVTFALYFMVFRAKSLCSWSRWPLSSMLKLESKMILCPGWHIYSF